MALWKVTATVTVQHDRAVDASSEDEAKRIAKAYIKSDFATATGYSSPRTTRLRAVGMGDVLKMPSGMPTPRRRKRKAT